MKGPCGFELPRPGPEQEGCAAKSYSPGQIGCQHPEEAAHFGAFRCDFQCWADRADTVLCCEEKRSPPGLHPIPSPPATCTSTSKPAAHPPKPFPSLSSSSRGPSFARLFNNPRLSFSFTLRANTGGVALLEQASSPFKFRPPVSPVHFQLWHAPSTRQTATPKTPGRHEPDAQPPPQQRLIRSAPSRLSKVAPRIS